MSHWCVREKQALSTVDNPEKTMCSGLRKFWFFQACDPIVWATGLNFLLNRFSTVLAGTIYHHSGGLVMKIFSNIISIL